MLKKVVKKLGSPLYVFSAMGSWVIPFGIHLVRRQKLGNPLAWHYGLVVNYGGWPVAYDLQQDKGPRRISIEELAEGHELRIIRSLQDLSQMEAAMARLREALTTMADWRLFDNNCEHFAEYVMTGVKRSGQIESIKGVAGFVLVLFILGKLAG